MMKIRSTMLETISEIDTAMVVPDTPTAINQLHASYLGEHMGPRALWYKSIRRYQIATKRLDDIKNELVDIRKNFLRSIANKSILRDPPSLEQLNIEFIRILDIYFEEGRDILLLTKDSLPRHYLRSISNLVSKDGLFMLVKTAIDHLTAKKIRIADEEVTLGFAALGFAHSGAFKRVTMLHEKQHI